MTAIDDMLMGDEPVVQKWLEDFGPLRAGQYVNEFNNGCMQIERFELTIHHLLKDRPADLFLAPLTNMSHSEH